ncbi:histidine phosphatase family protein [Nonomuraea gerenzanensis]|uniref:phosphoglycerate mutase (2,3-diphosphoglycerate-dependent) n=1 Tax=Nonomuraea gerenzanensis TaxID=93944 RepID=A0A1M4EJF5_9ACTN|nr:histidine phosphatase family protein [Nonomuraea gerenzanensis]UBU10605.1 histidine phosphatase family protein [Nonomuraea gerenzanensis]SBO99017.1 Phosphoglycerate mutase family [Nonomuraea gerenzanensis]
MGPERIMAVRHGESEANLAHREAGETPLVYERGDDEVTVTELGRAQAAALGRLLAALPGGEAPELVWCSPYLRALDTWKIAQEAWGVQPLPVTVDERLRDQEPGAFARFNLAAIRERHPEELKRRESLGAYAYRPPGGESLADVVVRLRAFLRDLDGRAAGRRVLIVAHDSVVLALRHVLDGRPDAELAAVLECTPVLNASVSVWRTGELVAFNDVAHLTS